MLLPFTSITGLPAPSTPVTVKEYAQQGLPFFHYYEEPTEVYGNFGKVKSVGEIDGVEEREYNLMTKVVKGGPCEDNTAPKPDDISNPTSPLSAFQSVAELREQIAELMVKNERRTSKALPNGTSRS
jgi:hypothetical protein